MPDPVNLANLHEMISGDQEIEKILFKEFYASSEECLAVLKQNCTDGANENWRSKAHALKGMALNMGAEQLGALCKKAQDSQAAPATEKKDLLQAIVQEYEKVKEFLESVY